MKLTKYKVRLNCIFVLVTQGPVTIYLEGGEGGKEGGGVKAISDWLRGGGKRLYKEV